MLLMMLHKFLGLVILLHQSVTVGNGHSVPVTNLGKGILPLPHHSFLLNHILYVPQMSHNLLSIHQFALDNQCRISFDAFDYVIQDLKSNQVLH